MSEKPSDLATAARLSHEAYIREPFFATETMAFTADEIGDTLWLAIRGSDHYQDWLKYNLKRGWVDWGGGRVLEGFRKAWRDIADMVLARSDGFRVARGEFAKVHLCGHSLGGAVALVGQFQVRADKVFTFGCPRAGDREYIDGLEGLQTEREEPTLITRVVNCADAVPIPGWLRGLKHPSKTVFFDRFGARHDDPSKWFMWKERMRRAIAHFGNPGIVGEIDHSHKTYMELCR